MDTRVEVAGIQTGPEFGVAGIHTGPEFGVVVDSSVEIAEVGLGIADNLAGVEAARLVEDNFVAGSIGRISYSDFDYSTLHKISIGHKLTFIN